MSFSQRSNQSQVAPDRTTRFTVHSFIHSSTSLLFSLPPPRPTTRLKRRKHTFSCLRIFHSFIKRFLRFNHSVDVHSVLTPPVNRHLFKLHSEKMSSCHSGVEERETGDGGGRIHLGLFCVKERNRERKRKKTRNKRSDEERKEEKKRGQLSRRLSFFLNLRFLCWTKEEIKLTKQALVGRLNGVE